MMDPSSESCQFKPDIALLVNSPFNQPAWPKIGMSADEATELADSTAQYWLDLCTAIHSNTGCDVIIDNFPMLPWRPHGNLSVKIPGDYNRYLDGINRAISAIAPAYVHIHDVAALAAYHGIANWYDMKYWHHAKLPVSFECVIHYIKTAVRIIESLYGYNRKVLVLDLDNTLWGGVIGDDGLDGIKIGQGSPEGEAFYAFQNYLLQLKQRGVLLTVCSKNEVINAKTPFQEHPEMLLSLDDFACFIANWQPKTKNMLTIAKQMNLGLDSFVFVDDNPAERELMRAQLPEVLTIELGNDPVMYPVILDSYAAHENTRLTDEDMQRTSTYQQNAMRESLLESVTDYDAYLVSLEQRAVLGAFETSRLDRITQLINKTNQFNFTTERMTRAEVEALMTDDSHFTLFMQLADRFGDNGIVVIVYGTFHENGMRIDGWVMSCRVFKRGVEYLTCNHLVELAKAHGKRYLFGCYKPTKKNVIISGLYEELGFNMSSSDADGVTNWVLDIDTYKPLPNQITVVQEI
jgi:FkbH-like protein